MARPRAFDLDVAIDRAMHLFWAKGYEGTTLGDLTDAMDINRPSLYAAFGSKEGVFRRALERYVEVLGAGLGAALQATTAREAVLGYMLYYADAAGRVENPRGCLLVQGALACSDASAPIRAALVEKRQSSESAVRQRLERARREGDFSIDAPPIDAARYVAAVCHGLAVQAAGGATCEELRRVVQLAMRAFAT